MKTSEAQVLIRGMVKDGKLSYSKEKGLTLTEKAAGLSLETLCELSTEQVSRIGQEFDPLFTTRKRLKSLKNSGVSVDALRAMLDELEGKTPTPKLPDTDKEPGTEDAETGNLFKPNGWEQVEAEQLKKEAEGAEDNQGELLLPGNEAEPGTDRGVPTEGHTTADSEDKSGSNGTDDNIRESVNGGDNPGTSRRSRGNKGGGEAL